MTAAQESAWPVTKEDDTRRDPASIGCVRVQDVMK
jgi:hypothetical protein